MALLGKQLVRKRVDPRPTHPPKPRKKQVGYLHNPGDPSNRGVTLLQGVTEERQGDEAGSPLGWDSLPPGLPGQLCPTTGYTVCFPPPPHTERLGWGAGDSSLILTAQHRAWHRSESIQLYKKLNLAPWM